MKARSAKNKGKRLQNKVRDLLVEKYSKVLEPGDFKSTTMGESGIDIQLSPAARKKFPWAIECKNQEAISIWKCLKQAEDAAIDEKLKPLLIFKRNKSKIYATVELTDFLELLDGQEK
tara:strand:+ start:492 stop:845 length:354 start_codon:yes stop_codon:yes gene_type:complete